MKILFVCDTMGSGGAERVISILANSFSLNGYEVSILMIGHDANKPFYKLSQGVKVDQLSNNKMGFLKKAKRIKKYILDSHPSVVISFLSYVCIYVWWSLKHTKIPYIVSERNDPNNRSRFKQFLLNKSFKHANGCVFQTKDALVWYKNIVKNKSIVIHNPVNLDYYPNSNVETKKQILYVGRLNEQKNCSMLINAFKIFEQNHPGYIFKMYGNGPLEVELRKQIADNILENKVFITASSKTWQKDEYNSSMFVLGSKYEGMPNVLAEALCLGIPCVSTDCTIGGPKELKKIFSDRLILSKNDSANDFALAMEQCLSISHKEAGVPEELSNRTIAEKWLSFIKRQIEDN